MKVVDIMKHCNATKTTIKKNNEPYTILCIVDYMQIDNIVWNDRGFYTYKCLTYIPQEIKKLTVDFIAPHGLRDITIYVK